MYALATDEDLHLKSLKSTWPFMYHMDNIEIDEDKGQCPNGDKIQELFEKIVDLKRPYTKIQIGWSTIETRGIDSR